MSQHWAFNSTAREQQEAMGMFDIPEFKQSIEEHGGRILPAQPHKSCSGSYHYDEW